MRAVSRDAGSGGSGISSPKVIECLYGRGQHRGNAMFMLRLCVCLEVEGELNDAAPSLRKGRTFLMAAYNGVPR